MALYYGKALVQRLLADPEETLNGLQWTRLEVSESEPREDDHGSRLLTHRGFALFAFLLVYGRRADRSRLARLVDEGPTTPLSAEERDALDIVRAAIDSVDDLLRFEGSHAGVSVGNALMEFRNTARRYELIDPGRGYLVSRPFLWVIG